MPEEVIVNLSELIFPGDRVTREELAPDSRLLGTVATASSGLFPQPFLISCCFVFKEDNYNIVAAQAFVKKNVKKYDDGEKCTLSR